MFIIGTSGHIDHGKSSLVRALTSMDPDRLPEEKRRGMTIDLGFAWLPLSNGDVAGIIDVPGHKDLIKNVIAGLWGIDAVLMVIAADDGWMPQTEEHVRILEFFDVRHGIVVITKIDQISDPEWLDLVEEDVRQRLQNTHFKDSPILRVSAKEGTHIQELIGCINRMASKTDGQADIGKPRLYIDRVFTISGSGTVVTGTLINGSIVKGQQVTLFPKNVSSRIRGLESYKQKAEKGMSGSRVALNLVGIEKGDLKRGDIVFGQEDQIKYSPMIDVTIELDPSFPHPLASNMRLFVYLGTREISARVRLLDKKLLSPGQSSFARFHFKEPVAARIGDHFVIRRPSPPATIGGGVILDPLAKKYKAKDRERVLSILRSRRNNLDISGLILSELAKNNYVLKKELLIASNFSAMEIAERVGSLALENKLVQADPWVIDLEYWENRVVKAKNILAEEHLQNPLQMGMNSAELQRILDLPRELFNHAMEELAASGVIVRKNNLVALSTHNPSPTREEEAIVSGILDLFKKQPANPPTKKELSNAIQGSDYIVRFMCDLNMLVALEEGILFESSDYQKIKERIIDVLTEKGKITIQDIRNLFGFSRKYILPLMKKLDKEGITAQEGDERVLVESHSLER